MNALWPEELDTDLPLHVHRQAMPETKVSCGNRMLRNIRNVGFFIVFVFSVVIVGCVMLTKGMVSRKKMEVSQDTQDEMVKAT